MNKLSHDKQAAKDAHLTNQLNQTIETYKAATGTERRAAIRHIDSFLGTLAADQKTFWLKFRERLERMNEKPPFSQKGDFSNVR